jgi:hypothetical protein
MSESLFLDALARGALGFLHRDERFSLELMHLTVHLPASFGRILVLRNTSNERAAVTLSRGWAAWTGLRVSQRSKALLAPFEQTLEPGESFRIPVIFRCTHPFGSAPPIDISLSRTTGDSIKVWIPVTVAGFTTPVAGDLVAFRDAWVGVGLTRGLAVVEKQGATAASPGITVDVVSELLPHLGLGISAVSSTNGVVSALGEFTAQVSGDQGNGAVVSARVAVSVAVARDGSTALSIRCGSNSLGKAFLELIESVLAHYALPCSPVPSDVSMAPASARSPRLAL